jgi:RimJ/RimL family protein N-acetyltransferase
MRDSLLNVFGRNLRLDVIQIEDAEYLFKLRNNPKYNTYLSQINGTLQDQKKWILDYKIRESLNEEIYYVIRRKDRTRCGLVRLYKINDENFTWGSWILDEKKPRCAAWESAILSLGVGFKSLNLPVCYVQVRRENQKALSIYDRLGMVITSEDEKDLYLEYRKSAFDAEYLKWKTHLEICR